MEDRINFHPSEGASSRQVEQFLDLLMANQHRIYAYILCRVSCVADADDLMQETTTVMWRKYDQSAPIANFAAWGKAFAHFHILKYHRTRPRHCQLSPETAEAISEKTDKAMDEYQVRLSALKKCIEKLNAGDRHLAQLRYEQDIRPKNIAEQVGKPLQNVYRALARMHEVLTRCVRRTLAEEAIS